MRVIGPAAGDLWQLLGKTQTSTSLLFFTPEGERARERRRRREREMKKMEGKEGKERRGMVDKEQRKRDVGKVNKGNEKGNEE